MRSIFSKKPELVRILAVTFTFLLYDPLLLTSSIAGTEQGKGQCADDVIHLIWYFAKCKAACSNLWNSPL